jgi:hypothetical protein
MAPLYASVKLVLPCRQKLVSFFWREIPTFGARQQEFDVSNCLTRLTGYQGKAQIGIKAAARV